ncbi:hypothetical protein MKX03_012691, partial [Papaver bracteatum]
LHWIDNRKIVAFNLADEEFRLIQPPPCYDLSPSFCTLRALKGNLCFCHQRNEEYLLDIWSLKKNATTEASWSKDLSIAYDSAKEIDKDYPIVPLLITKKNEVLFVHARSILNCYDPKSTTVVKLWDDKKWDLMMITAHPHMNSFVALKALGERSENPTLPWW